jgi:ATP/ADP translocase
MLCAAAVSGQFIAGKATRDALFLSYLDVTLLPMIVIATSAFSILLVTLGSKMLVRLTPVTFVPLAFATNAVFLLIEWVLTPFAPAVAASAVYLQISGLGPMLGSGFWLIASERFDPHTARHQFGRITGVATLGGLVGAIVAERVAAIYGIVAMLPLLAAVNLICAWQVRELASSGHQSPIRDRIDDAPELAAESPASGLRVLAHTAYLRNLAAIVTLGTIAATLADYAFKVQAVNAFDPGDELLRFFAIYYAAISLLSFVVQSVIGAAALQRLGLALTTSTPSVALLLGSVGAILAPGLEGALVARGAESIFRGSLFRTGYEIFYTPVPAAEKRAAKSIIDVGFDRLGDAIGGGLLRLLLLLPSARQYSMILIGAIACSAAALIVARRLNHGYIHTLERNLLNRALELDLADVEDITTRTVMLKTLRPPGTGETHDTATISRAARSDTLQSTDPEIREILALRSRDRERVTAVLKDEQALPPTLIPHVVPLLAWDPVAEDAVRALRRVAEEHVGQLTDALIDPNQPFAVRRRLARVFSVCVSQRAVDGLLLGLEDLRFEVRFQCGRSLAAVASKNGLIRIDDRVIFDAVRREVAVGRPVWESQRLLDQVDQDQTSFVDELLKDRAGQSLAHVFTLLSLVLPAAPLQISYRGLHTDDPLLRGTALEYLEEVLPADIRERLWPFLGGELAAARPSRSREDIVEELLRSNESIMLNLEELRKQARAARRPDAAARV